MGRTYAFECSRCGYRAKVSGRADRGLNLCVQTILCRECKELYDAVTRIKLPEEAPSPAETAGKLRAWRLEPPPGTAVAPPFQAAANRLLYFGTPRLRWVQFKPQCPVSPRHRTQPWNEPDACPRCGHPLERAVLPYRIWD